MYSVRLFAAFSLAFLTFWIASPAQAAQCMQGKFQNVPQLKAADRGKTFDALVADEDVKAFQGFGLVVAPCRPELMTPSGQAVERDAVCRMTYADNDAYQAQLKKVFGIHPGLLCQSAEKVAGRWSGQKTGWRDGIAPWLSEIK